MVDWCCNILFCTNEARAFRPFGCQLSDLRQTEQAAVFGHWLGLGRFDHVFVTLAKEPETLLKAERLVQACSHASSHWSGFGRVIKASWDVQAGQWPVDQGAVLGVCGIKLAHGLRDALGDLESITQRIEEVLQPLGGHWLVASTTGWEDLALLYWVDDFTVLSNAVGKVRGLKIEDLSPPVQVAGVHAVLTTCTVPGIDLPPGSFSNLGESSWVFNREWWVDQIRERIRHEVPLDWALRFELRPGHFDAFQAELKRVEAEVGVVPPELLQYRNVLGQYDLRVQAAGSTHGAWLEYLGRVALPVAAKVGSLVRSMETHLHIQVPDFSEGLGAANTVTPVSTANYEKTTVEPLERACKNAAIAPHTIEMLHATHSRLIALQEDDLQHGTFHTVENLFVRLAEGLSERSGEHEHLAADLPYWLYMVERSLSDRYRGTYPLGEAVVPRLGTYQASHHGFLAAADCIAQGAFDLARTSLNTQLAASPMPEVAVCTFIGSSPSPNAQTFRKYMRSGFIELPSIMVFRLQELWILLHEVGHVFIDVTTEHHNVVYWGQKKEEDGKIRLEVQEILADLFACCAGYRGDVMAFGETRIQVQDTYLPDAKNKFTSSTKMISQVRLLAVHWLMEDELSKYTEPGLAMQKFKETAMESVRQELGKAALSLDAAAYQEQLAEKAIFPSPMPCGPLPGPRCPGSPDI